MSTKERRRREVLSREALILATATEMLAEEGFFGLSMDRLAEAVEYSKPTLYAHFESKEDLVLAAVNESLRRRVELFTRATRMSGRAREAMMAVGVADGLFVHNYRGLFRVEQLFRESSIWEKSSEKRRKEHEHIGQGCMGAMASIVLRAIEDGDLDPKRYRPEVICDGLRNLSIGTHAWALAQPRDRKELAAIYSGLFRNQHALLDGAQWHPLFTEWDYHASYRRAMSEVFPDEKPLPPHLSGVPA